MKTMYLKALMVAATMAMVGCVTAADAPKADAAASAQGPWIGAWKRSSDMGTTIFTMKLERDNGFSYTIRTTNAKGEPLGAGAELPYGKFDGKPYPETGNPNADFNAFQRIDDHSYSLVDLKGGKETGHITITISPDGKTRTSVWKMKDAQGKETLRTSVSQRVE